MGSRQCQQGVENGPFCRLSAGAAVRNDRCCPSSPPPSPSHPPALAEHLLKTTKARFGQPKSASGTTKLRVLKSGCRIEELQLKACARLEPAPTFYTIIASRVLSLTMLGRDCPVSCSRLAPLRNRTNTRYGWVASPFPTGTFTRQETPSFARR
ncbi:MULTISPECIES: hypothetical protein [unclassified Thiocapsa]|uniref:hypothetical protein n=1 Tax=unclassified Thiocapsa TaxID=2641286 RepID=UPI0035AE6DBC